MGFGGTTWVLLSLRPRNTRILFPWLSSKQTPETVAPFSQVARDKQTNINVLALSSPNQDWGKLYQKLKWWITSEFAGTTKNVS